MKKKILVLGLLGLAPLALLLLFNNGCGQGRYLATPSGVPTPTPYGGGVGSIVVNNIATGGCPVTVILDAATPVAVPDGTKVTFNQQSYGDHNMTFSTASAVPCATPGTCYLIIPNGNGAITTTGYGYEFYLSGGTTEIATVSDNGCNQISVSGLY